MVWLSAKRAPPFLCLVVVVAVRGATSPANADNDSLLVWHEHSVQPAHGEQAHAGACHDGQLVAGIWHGNFAADDRAVEMLLINLVAGASYELRVSIQQNEDASGGPKDAYAYVNRITPAQAEHRERIKLPAAGMGFVLSAVLLDDCASLSSDDDSRMLLKITRVVRPGIAADKLLDVSNVSGGDRADPIDGAGAKCVVSFVDGCNRCPHLRHFDDSQGDGEPCPRDVPSRGARSATGQQDDESLHRTLQLEGVSGWQVEREEAWCMQRARDFHADCGNSLYMQIEAVFLPSGRVERWPEPEAAAAAMGRLKQQNLALLHTIQQYIPQEERHDTLEDNLKDLRRVLSRLVCRSAESLTPSGSYCLEPKDPPILLGPDGWQLGRHHFLADPGLVALLQPIFKARSVLDLGCGCGQYGAALTGVDYRGFDGALNVEEFTGGRVQWADLTLPLLVGAADFVLLLEVGEHVPAEHEEQVLTNAADNARCGLVLSWAVPGQNGARHVNLRSNDYIQQKVEARGFELDESLTRQGRERCQLPWFAHTFMFFWRSDAAPLCNAWSGQEG
jgi:hypothetical protein